MMTKNSDLNLQFNPFPIIETDRLMLRSFLMDDAKALLNMRTNDRVMKYLGSDKMKDIEEAKSFIQKVNINAQQNRTIEWVITMNNTFIGKLGFWRILSQHRRGEIGYNLLPEYFGKGIMSEAVSAVLKYGFESIGFHSIEANLDPNNIKSSSLLERSGFRKEGYFKESYFYKGEYTDTLTYGLLVSDWKK